MNNFTVTSVQSSNMWHTFCKLYYCYLRVVYFARIRYPYRNYSYEWNLQVIRTRMYVNGHHWNPCKLVFAGTHIWEPGECRTCTRVYV